MKHVPCNFLFTSTHFHVTILIKTKKYVYKYKYVGELQLLKCEYLIQGHMIFSFKSFKIQTLQVENVQDWIGIQESQSGKSGRTFLSYLELPSKTRRFNSIYCAGYFLIPFVKKLMSNVAMTFCVIPPFQIQKHTFFGIVLTNHSLAY